MMSFAQHKVLIADDNQDIADTTAEVLRLDGFKVKAVYDGRQAVEEARVFRPILALLDINMPVMNGYDAAATLRKEQAANEPLVLVAHTSEAHPAALESIWQAGFDHHLAKPADPCALGSLLDSLIRRALGNQPRTDPPSS